MNLKKGKSSAQTHFRRDGLSVAVNVQPRVKQNDIIFDFHSNFINN